MSPQYGERRPTNDWDLLASLGHHCKFQRLSRFGGVTARHSSSGRQPNIAALNRRRHLYSAGRPSRWALAHILVVHIMFTDVAAVSSLLLLCPYYCCFITRFKLERETYFRRLDIYVHARVLLNWMFRTNCKWRRFHSVAINCRIVEN